MMEETKVPTFTTAQALVEYVRETADHSYRALKLLGIPADAGIMNRWELLKECRVLEVLDKELLLVEQVVERVQELFDEARDSMGDLQGELERANDAVDNLEKIAGLLRGLRK